MSLLNSNDHSLHDDVGDGMRTTPRAPQTQDLLASMRQVCVEDIFTHATVGEASKLAAQARRWQGHPVWHEAHAGCFTLEWECRIGRQGNSARIHLAPIDDRVVVETVCTCGRPYCVHAAALILRVQRYFEWPLAVDPVAVWLAELHNSAEAKPRSHAPRPAPRLTFPLLAEVNASRAGTIAVALAERIQATRSRPERLRPLAHKDIDGDDDATPHAPIAACLRTFTHTFRRDGYRWHVLEGQQGEALLEMLLDSGVCHLGTTLQALCRDQTLAPKWDWVPAPNGTQTLRWSLALDTPAQKFIVDQAWYVDSRRLRIGRISAPPALLRAVERMPPFPHATARTLRETWPPNELLASVPAPLDIADAQRVQVPMRPVIVLHATPCKAFAVAGAGIEQPGAFVYLLAYAQYRDRRVALGRHRHASTLAQQDTGRSIELIRDFNAEDQCAAQIQAHRIRAASIAAPTAVALLEEALSSEAMAHRLYHHSSNLKALHHELQHLARLGFEIEHDAELPFDVVVWKQALSVRYDEEPDSGWFNFGVGLEVDGEYVNLLPLITQALQRREFDPAATSDSRASWLVEAAGGRWIELPLTRVREAITPILSWIDVDSKVVHKSLRLSRLQAAVVTAGSTTQDSHVITSIDAMCDIIRRLIESDNAALPETPAGFRGNLRAYQREGLRWLAVLQANQLGGILADDMGLGKTVQILAHLQAEKFAGRLRRPALIVVPTSLIFNWTDEAARFTPELKLLTLHGPQRHDHFADIADADLVLTTYGLVALDLDRLRAQSYSMLVIDESQWVKNPDTRAARALGKLQADARVSLTGTPLENHLGELWAQFNLILPGYLGERRRFNRVFRTPIEKREDDYKRAALRARIAPFLLRRNKAQVAPELPIKTETTLYLEMGEAQRALYEALRMTEHQAVREAIANRGVKRSGIAVLSALLKLRQACCDPRLVNLPGTTTVESSCKLDALSELTRGLIAEGRSLLIFSQFTRMLGLIATQFDACGFTYAVLTGDSANRRTPVERFQNGDVPILLISLKAGGVGLNLTAADTIVHFDPWWNPATEDQATDRAHRIGQDKPVFVYRLVCRNSVEEKIEALKQRKSDLVRGMLEGDATAHLRLDVENIDALLGS